MLKKPSQLFGEQGEQKEFDNISFDPESKAYQSFKHNLDKINSLSNFNETIENYRNSVDNVNNLSEEIEDVRNDIKKMLTAEDLDRAMMSQFVMIDETIAEVQDKVKSINESKLKEIRSDVNEITTSVNEFLEVEAPKYNKLLFDHQRNVDRKYTKFEEKINNAFDSAVEEIEEVINDIHSKVTSTVDEQITGINRDNLESIIEDVKALGEKQEGKYKKIIVNSELRIDNRYHKFEETVNHRYHKFEETVNHRCDDLSSIISQLTEQVSSVEGDNSDIVKTLNDKISNLTDIQESVASVKEEIKQQQTFLSDYAKEIRQDVGSLKADVARSEKHIKDQNLRVEEYGQFKENVENKVEEYQNVISEQQKQNEDFQKSIKTYKGNIDKNIKNVVARVDDQQTYNEHWQGKVDKTVKKQEEITEKFKKDIDKTVKEQEEITEKFKKDIDDKVESLEKGFGVNEEIVKKLEKEFSLNKEIVKEAVTKLDIDGIEKKNFELSNKIKYLEEVFDKFSDKAILTESLITEPPSTKNSDPLTPLDQNFVTLDQLNKHYNLFLNRIQQQLSTLGGGGEVRLEFLDDIDRSSAKVNGKFLKYNSATGKWEGATGGGGADTETTRDAIQGYYGYETDYYTVGVANTSQEIGAGVTTMIMPQVASVFQELPTIMTGVGTNPYVGTAATVGTGQTEFSFAGLSSGASCIVRTALAFNPDEDNTNLDIQLKFTTNTATQAAGTTNFTILKEQALIMNEGGDQQYISENVFSFFIGSKLEGTTYNNSGSFRIEVIPTSDGELEVLAVTVNVAA